MQVSLDQVLKPGCSTAGEFALDAVTGGACGINGSSEPVVSIRRPCGLGKLPGVDRIMNRRLEPDKIEAVGNGSGDIRANRSVSREQLGVVWRDGDGVDNATLVGAARGLVDAVVGPVDQPMSEARSVEGAVEKNEREVGEGVGAVLVGGRSAEPPAQGGREGIEGNGHRVGFRAAYLDEPSQGSVRLVGVGAIVPNRADEGIEVVELGLPGRSNGSGSEGVVGGVEGSVEVHGVLLASVGTERSVRYGTPRATPPIAPAATPDLPIDLPFCVGS